ncbi:MAG TPA: toxin-antitoxin system HicB family antitoxin [Phycisphaerae bacterium]|jgi:hypothetical protein
MTKEQKILAEAKEIAASATTWADFSNALFDPEEGIITRVIRTREQRRAFTKTPEYAEIQRLLDELIDHTGLSEGATPAKSGKFVVRMPTSLHMALEREANREGVSLNQLVVTKLAFQLGAMVHHG